MKRYCGKCGRKLNTVNGRCPNCEKAPWTSLLTSLRKAFVVFCVTVFMLAAGLFGMLYILAKGPSPSAQKLFVMSVRETSAIGFLVNWFFTQEEIDTMYAMNASDEIADTDTSLVTIQKPLSQDSGSTADEWGLVDEDGDGIIIDPVHGEGYSGYMMVVQDPSRVILGASVSDFGKKGYTVGDMAVKFDAVAAINAGGFDDPGGTGNGSVPDSMVIYEGKVYYGQKGSRQGYVSLDKDHILHEGKPTKEDAEAQALQYGVGFGPVLISNGEPIAEDQLHSGINPRTAIGQRSDGAILLLVIDGRQAISIGATLQDLVDIFLKYGAVNACNLDGGSSSMMWFNGEYVNNCASVIGLRPVPTTFLVLKEGTQSNGK